MNVWEPILAIILALTNFTIKPNPKAPSADVSLAHLVDDADAMVYADYQPFIDNYPVWQKLGEDPLVKRQPDLRDAFTQAAAQIEGGRAMVKNLVGVDFATDIASATAYLKYGATGPTVMVEVRGKLPTDLPERVGKALGATPQVIDGRTAVVTADGQMLGFAKDGALLMGAKAWVEPRLADAWKPSPRAKGSAWAQIATALATKPFALWASKPSAGAVAGVAAALPPSFGRDLIERHALVIVTASATGVSWTYQAKDAAFAARIKVASEGLIALMRAAHVAPRGIAAMAIAALPSYAGRSPDLDAAIAHKDQILAAVDQLTGDGQFQATVKLSGTTVTAVARGRSISDVVPLGAVVGLAAVGALTARGKVQASAAPPVPAVTTPKPVRTTPPRPTTPRPTPKPTPARP